MEVTVLVKVPLQSVYDTTTQRIVGRLTKDIDLFKGVKEICHEHGVTAAHFQCIGSLQYATYVQVERDGTHGRIKYSAKKCTHSPVELLSATGFVGYDEQGKTDIHMHGVFVDCDSVISGGHFLEDENPVAVTIEYIIFPLEDVVMQRREDEIWGMPVFQFSKGGLLNGDNK